MKGFHIITELDKEKWSNFVYNHPKGNIFQTPQMYEVYKNTKNWEPIFLAACDNNGDISGILLSVIQREGGGFFGRLTSRVVCWGGPVVKDDKKNSESAEILIEAFDQALNRKAVYAQFRNLWSFSKDRGCFINNGYTYKEHLNFLIDLDIGEESLWARLYSSRRNEIRKSQKAGVKVRFASSICDIKESYSILQEVYKKVKTPLAGISLFESLYNILTSETLLKVFLAVYNDKIIGTLYLLIYRDKLYVWYAASLSCYYDKYPNDILYWEAMKWGYQNGYKLFDFGGAGSPYREYGVREFKKKFGGRLINYGRFVKIYQPIISKVIDLGMKLLKKI